MNCIQRNRRGQIPFWTCRIIAKNGGEHIPASSTSHGSRGATMKEWPCQGQHDCVTWWTISRQVWLSAYQSLTMATFPVCQCVLSLPQHVAPLDIKCQHNHIRLLPWYLILSNRPCHQR